MKTALAILAAAAALYACDHGRTGLLPPPPDPAAAARVVVIRNDNLFDWWIAVTVRVDGVPAARLRAGEHAALDIAPGLRGIAVGASAVTIAAEAGQVYYCLIGAGDSPSGFEIERLDAGQGRGWVEKTRPLP